jgi:hypothetical protein
VKEGPGLEGKEVKEVKEVKEGSQGRESRKGSEERTGTGHNRREGKGREGKEQIKR